MDKSTPDDPYEVAMNLERITEPAKHVADGASIGTILATFAGWLPEMAAFVSLVWGLIRIYETDTVRKIIARFSR